MIIGYIHKSANILVTAVVSDQPLQCNIDKGYKTGNQYSKFVCHI